MTDVINQPKTSKKRRRKKKKNKKHKQDAAPITQEVKSIEEILDKADEMWKKVKNLAKNDKDFVQMKDKKKLELFRDKFKYKEFMTEYPVTARYMVAMGQYNRKAFKRMLTKISHIKHPPPHERPKNYMEDQWIRRQADYVRYLWEAYQRGHWNPLEAKYVWEDAYKNLKGEFDDFRDKYKDIEEARKIEKKQLAASNASDLLGRLKEGTQKLDTSEEEELLMNLQNLLYKRRYKNTLQQLVKDVPRIEPSIHAVGQGPEEEDEEERRKKTITMVEHVDPDRYHEVPEHLILTDEEAAKLPGFRNHL
jgi:hypothetical protein